MIVESIQTNQDLIEQHAAPGLIGLVGGSDMLNRGIRRFQGRGARSRNASLWSHAFLFSGRRADGQHWVIESDLDFHRKQMRLGVQENRVARYFDDEAYPNLAILDFGLSAQQTQIVLTEALDLLAGLTGYSLREIVGTLIALQRPRWRVSENLMAQERSMYCSAMVQQCYAKIGIEFTEHGVVKNTMPDDIDQTLVSHQKFELIRCRMG